MKRFLTPLAALALLLCGLAPLWLLAPAADELGKLPRVDKLEHKNYTEKIPDTDITFEMIAIPGGAYLMGSPSNEKDRRPDEGPQHPVAVRPFWMASVEVTWDIFDAYRDECGAKNKEAGNADPGDNEKRLEKSPDAVTGPTPPYSDETFGHAREGHPVLGISHHTSMELCRWLSKKTGKVYRLPTEAEWEWAARAGTTTAYSFGDDPAQLGDYAIYKKNSEMTTKPIGKKKPNPWGLHDMHGSIAEWCLDHYVKDDYAAFPKDRLTIAPVALPTNERFSHVCRGGSWADPPAECRSAARRPSNISWLRQDPQRPRSIWWLTDAEFVGLRVVRAVNEQDNLKGLRTRITRKSN